MNDSLDALYRFSLEKGHIPSTISFEKFVRNASDETWLRSYYDKLAAVPVDGNQYGAAGADWGDFSNMYLPKKKMVQRLRSLLRKAWTVSRSLVLPLQLHLPKLRSHNQVLSRS